MLLLNKSLAVRAFCCVVIGSWCGTSLAEPIAIHDGEKYANGKVSEYTKNSGVFTLVDENKSRAEFRYRNVGISNENDAWVVSKDTFELSGTMTIARWNHASEKGKDSDRISLIQVLNNKLDYTKGRGSNPVSQLTLRKTAADSDDLMFILIAGRSGNGVRCGDIVTKEGKSHQISVKFKAHSHTIYSVDGVSCTIEPGDGDMPGIIGGDDDGKYFYAKLGAYVTGGSKNKRNASGNNVVVKWSDIKSY